MSEARMEKQIDRLILEINQQAEQLQMAGDAQEAPLREDSKGQKE